MLFIIAKIFIYLHQIIHVISGYKIPGLGFIQRQIIKDHIIPFKGKKIFFNHQVQGSYDLMLIGRSNEPETHLFFSKILKDSKKEYSFIDVGASVGEMVFGISIYPVVKEIYAFEPRKECTIAMEKSKELNNENRLTIIHKAVGAEQGKVTFYSNSSGSGSGIYQDERFSEEREMVEQTTLDTALPREMMNPILLIDVEGYEPMVIKGGLEFIKNNSPIIIFEYNEVSKKKYRIKEIQQLLGDEYTIYRLRSDGNLDFDIENAWNCVGIKNNREIPIQLL